MSNWTARRPHTLNIVGASVRAAAVSARGAGFEVWCADRFGDVDLQPVGPSVLVVDYPRGLVPAMHEAPHAPWLYTGALENHAALVEEIAALRPLIGNRGDALRRARDLVYWTSALREHDVSAPRIALSPEAVPDEPKWLVKPLHSGGGAGIRWFRRDASAEERQHGQRPVVYQEYVEGTSLSAVFVATDGEAVLLGVTKQLLGRSWRDALGAGAVEQFDHRGRTDFHYAGSVGPYLLSDDLIRQANTIGRVLAAECDLVGLFGVDLVMAGGRLWTIEINPRYTASIEVLERASAVRTTSRRRSRLLCVQAHVDACTRGILPQPIGQSDEACRREANRVRRE